MRSCADSCRHAAVNVRSHLNSRGGPSSDPLGASSSDHRMIHGYDKTLWIRLRARRTAFVAAIALRRVPGAVFRPHCHTPY